MAALATIGTLIEVTPWDDLQHWPDAGTVWGFIDDRTPFRFRVAGELNDDELFFGLYGPVESGPEHYQNLICNIMLRQDNPDWHNSTKCSANFKVGPTVAKRVSGYDPTQNADLPFYFHPKGTYIEGYPRVSRFGGIRVVADDRNGDAG